MTPKFFNAHIGDVSREFPGLRHFGLLSHLEVDDDVPKVNMPRHVLSAVLTALIPAIDFPRPKPFFALAQFEQQHLFKA